MASPEGSPIIPPSPDNRVKVTDYTSFLVTVTPVGGFAGTVALTGPEDCVYSPDATVTGGSGQRIVYVPLRKSADGGNLRRYPFGSRTFQAVGMSGSLVASDSVTVDIGTGDFGFGVFIDDWNATFPSGSRTLRLHAYGVPDWGFDAPITFSGTFLGMPITFTPNPVPYSNENYGTDLYGGTMHYPEITLTLPIAPPTGAYTFDVTGTATAGGVTHTHSTLCVFRVGEGGGDGGETWTGKDIGLDPAPFEVRFYPHFVSVDNTTAIAWTADFGIVINRPDLVYEGNSHFPPSGPDDNDYLNEHYPCVINGCTLNYTPSDPPEDCVRTIAIQGSPIPSEIYAGYYYYHFQGASAPVGGWGVPGLEFFPYAIKIRAEINGYFYEKWFSFTGDFA